MSATGPLLDSVALLGGGALAGPDEVEQIPAEAGAYALFLRLDARLRFERRALAGVLEPGWYAYAGSAKGPGGMRARLARHMRAGKAVRWHVDEVSNAAAEVAALAIPGGSECAIVDALLGSGRFSVPIPGFGSSDCRHCAAHLLAYKE
ncbi:MAG: GIY-YIG nuclease family protein [Sphingomonadaceae bacterium]|nr:GIY-YIG nuclease family protein [Sphingomonadaceae bacterium]